PGDPAASTVTVVGILPGDGPVLGALGRTIVVTVDEARAAFGPIGFTRADVRLQPGATADGVSAALEGRITTDPYVITGPSDLAASLGAATSDFQATTSLLAAVATRRQVADLILVQALGLGAIGSALGILVGIALAAAMVGYVRSIAS